MRGHLLHRLDHELPRIMTLVRDVALLREPRELVVRVVLVAVLDQQVARGLADPYADHVLPVFLELEDEGGEVRVPGQEDECADLRPREDQLQRVDGEANVGRVLLVRPVGRGKDQIDR